METQTKWIIGGGAVVAALIAAGVAEHYAAKKTTPITGSTTAKEGVMQGGLQKIIQPVGTSAITQSYTLAPNTLVPPVFQKYAGIFTVFAPLLSSISDVTTTGGATAIGSGSQTQLLLTGAPATATITWAVGVVGALGVGIGGGGTTTISFQ